MALILLDANPIIAMGGQIAAIILCIFVLISVLLTLAINLGLAFLLAWIREKVDAIKFLRPTVDSINKSSEAALHGVSSDALDNQVIRTVASVPGGVHTADQKVEQVSRKVAEVAIEFRARTVQAQTIAKAFFKPRPEQRLIREHSRYQTLPAATADLSETASKQAIPSADGAASPNETQQAITSSQEQHARTR